MLRAAILLLLGTANGATLGTFGSLTGGPANLARRTSPGTTLTLATTFQTSASVSHTQGSDSLSVTLPSEYYWLLWPADGDLNSAHSSVTMVTTYDDSGAGGSSHSCSGTVSVVPLTMTFTTTSLDCGSLANSGNFANGYDFTVTLTVVEGDSRHRFPCRDPGSWSFTLTQNDGSTHSGTNDFSQDSSVTDCWSESSIPVTTTLVQGGLGDYVAGESVERSREQLLMRFALPGGLPQDGRLELTYLDIAPWSAIKNATPVGTWAGAYSWRAALPVLSHEERGRDAGSPTNYRVTLDWSTSPMATPIAVVPNAVTSSSIQIMLTLASNWGTSTESLNPYWTVSKTSSGTAIDNVRWARPGYGDSTVPSYTYSQL